MSELAILSDLGHCISKQNFQLESCRLSLQRRCLAELHCHFVDLVFNRGIWYGMESDSILDGDSVTVGVDVFDGIVLDITADCVTVIRKSSGCDSSV